MLNQYGYEIHHEKVKSHYYWLTDRIFNVPEIKILIDAVQAANFISEEKTVDLTAKLASLAGHNQAEILQRGIIFQDSNKQQNKYIYYNVDALYTAISAQKQASFVYYDYDTGKND